jgi:hypothetical protein
MTLVEVFHGSNGTVPLVDRVGRYDENEGWGDGMCEARKAAPAFANDAR